MSNPLLIATKGKGFLPMLARGRVITSRYGLTPRKMEGSLAILIDTLNQYTCSATIPVTASALESNPKAIMKDSLLGLELAIHGLDHLDYSQLSLENQISHLHQARGIFERLGTKVTGFRCPYLRWNADTLTALKYCGFTYDSSQALALDVIEELSTDAYTRVLDFYRAQSAHDYPALPHLTNGLVRIPYCLPDDEALVDRLHLSNPTAMAEIWLEMLTSTYQAGELFTLGLHPERIHLCQAALKVVLEKARTLSPCVWIARLDEIAAWYLALGETSFEIRHETRDLYHVKINAPARATILVRSLGVMASTQPRGLDYHSVLTNDFTIQSNKRPLIGVSPNAPLSLERFLRHQGYLFEISPESQAYSYYIDRSSFNPKDERPLLIELERGQSPIVRISRWPDSAQCGLAITGDVDAFTIWDYGRRIFTH